MPTAQLPISAIGGLGEAGGAALVLEGRGLVQVGVVRVVAGGVAVVGRWRSGVEDLVVAEGELLLDLVAVGVGRG